MKTKSITRFSSVAVLLSTIIFSCITAVPVKAQSNFEGEMNSKIDIPGRASISANMYIKGSMSRVEMDMPAMQGKTVILYDKATKKMDILMPAMKKYMERSADDAASQAAGQQLEGSTMKEADSTKSIAGYSCHKFVVTMKDGKTIDIWATKDLGPLQMPQSMNFMGSPGHLPPWAQKMQSDGLVGLSSVIHNSDGSVQMTMEVTSINKKSLSDDLFQIPSGYTVMSVPGMQ